MYERLARSPQHPFSNNAPSCRTLVSENASRFSAVNFYIFPVAVSGSIILAAIMYGKLRDIYSEETQQEQDEKASRQQPPVLDRTTLPTYKAALLLVVQIVIIFADGFTLSCLAPTELIALVMPAVAVAALLLYSAHERQSPTSVRLYLASILLADLARICNYKTTTAHWVVGSLSAVSALVGADILLAYNHARNPGSLTELSKALLNDDCEQDPSVGSVRERMYYLVMFGFYRGCKILDLPSLAYESSPDPLAERLYHEWWSVDQLAPYSFLKAALRALFWPLVDIIPPRLCYFGLKFYLAVVMRRVLLFVRDKATTSSDSMSNIFISLILTLALMTIVSVWHTNATKRLDTILSGMLNSLMAGVQMELPARIYNTDHSITRAEIAVKNIMQHIDWFHQVWLAPVELVLGLFLFVLLEEAVALYTLFFLLSGTFVVIMIGKRMIINFSTATRITNHRETATESLVLRLKDLQIQGLPHFLSSYLKPFRVAEVSRMKKESFYLILSWTLAVLENNGSRLVVLAAGLLSPSSVSQRDTVDLFTATVLISLVLEPSFCLIQDRAQLSVLLSSFNQLQGFVKPPSARIRSNFVDSITFGDRVQFDHDSGFGTESDLEEDEDENGAVDYDDVSLSVSLQSDPVLRNVTFTIEQRSLVTVAGPPGSGKSLLLKSMNNTAAVTHGQLRLVHDVVPISYCGRNPWLRDSTIKRNIIGGYSFNSLRYNAVIEACCLRDDLNAFPEGHQTRVGRNGCQLSTCQKQRVALARALYQQPGLLLLDDIFRDFSEEISVKIFSALFKLDGLVRAWNCSTFLVTNAVRHQRMADQAIFIDARRRVSIFHGRGNIRNFLMENAHINEEDINELSSDSDVLSKYETLPSSVYDPTASSSSGQFAQPCFQPTTVNFSQSNTQRSPRGMENISQCDYKHMSLRKVARFYFSSVSVWEYSLWVAAAVLLVTHKCIVDVFIYLAGDSSLYDKPFFRSYSTILAFELFLMTLESWLYLLVFTPRCALSIHHSVLESISHRWITFADIEETSLLKSISTDMTAMDNTVPLAFKQSFYSLCKFFTDTLIICCGVPLCCFVNIPGIGIVYAMQSHYRTRLQEIQQLSNEAERDGSLAQINANRDKEYMRYRCWKNDRYFDCVDAVNRLQRLSRARAMLQCWSSLCVHIATASVIITITLSCTVFDIGLSLPRLTFAFAFAYSLTVVMERGFRHISVLDNCSAVLTRLEKLSTSCTAAIDGKVEPPPEWPRHGTIMLSNAASSYRSPTESQTAIAKLSLSIKARERIQVTGQAKSGKSSFLATLLDLVQYQGSIKLDGVELSTIPRDRLNSSITSLPQLFLKLPGSVRHNVFPWDVGKSPADRRMDDATIITVLSKVGIWEDISLQGGLDSQLHKVVLSDTQESQLGIARGILHHRSFGTKVVLVDDVTDGMAVEDEMHARHVMDEEFSRSTVVFVAPKRATMNNIHRVLQFKNGQGSFLSEPVY